MHQCNGVYLIDYIRSFSVCCLCQRELCSITNYNYYKATGFKAMEATSSIVVHQNMLLFPLLNACK